MELNLLAACCDGFKVSKFRSRKHGDERSVGDESDPVRSFNRCIRIKSSDGRCDRGTVCALSQVVDVTYTQIRTEFGTEWESRDYRREEKYSYRKKRCVENNDRSSRRIDRDKEID